MTRTPFVTQLQCLRCGAKWWSPPVNRTTCPNCAPQRVLQDDGSTATKYAIAKELP